MKIQILLVLCILFCKSNIVAQILEEILSGKYDIEISQWDNGLKYSSEWRECKISMREIEEKLKAAKGNAAAELIGEALNYYNELHDLAYNELPEDIYKKVREGDRNLALEINKVVKLEDLYSWDRTYAACREKIKKAEKWALEKSEAAQQFPEEFKAGTLDAKLYAEKVKNAYGVPTPESDYGPYDKYLSEMGDPEEKATLIAMSSREQLYARIRPLYLKGTHQETVVTEKCKVNRTIISGDDEFKVFEIKEAVPEFKFYSIDGHFVKKEDFDVELAKYKK